MTKNFAKKIVFATIFSTVLFSVFFVAKTLTPQVMAVETLEYTPLSPLPHTTSGKTTNMNIYLLGMFKLLIGVAGVLAVIMIVIGGIQYMSTDAIGDKLDGKGKIQKAVGGLLLAVLSYLLLQTINPNLLKINAGLPPTPPPQAKPASLPSQTPPSAPAQAPQTNQAPPLLQRPQDNEAPPLLQRPQDNEAPPLLQRP